LQFQLETQRVRVCSMVFVHRCLFAFMAKEYTVPMPKTMQDSFQWQGKMYGASVAVSEENMKLTRYNVVVHQISVRELNRANRRKIQLKVNVI